MNYAQLSQLIQDYCETTESSFVANIPTFVQVAEERIYNTVQLPAIRKNVTGTMTAGNQYLSLPDDWLANFSLAVITPVTLAQSYLITRMSTSSVSVIHRRTVPAHPSITPFLMTIRSFLARPRMSRMGSKCTTTTTRNRL
jgi:hypothetical protein